MCSILFRYRQGWLRVGSRDRLLGIRIASIQRALNCSNQAIYLLPLVVLYILAVCSLLGGGYNDIM